MREAFEAAERERAEEAERKRQAAIAERARIAEEKKEAKKRKEQEERDAAKARSEARQAEAVRRKKDAEAAKHKSNQQAVQTDRAAITSGIAPSSQLGSAQSAAQIFEDLRKDSVLDRMKAGGSAATATGTPIVEQRRLVTRQTPAPTPTISPGGVPNAPIAASPSRDENLSGLSSANTSAPKPSSSWVQDFSLNKLDLNNIPEDAKKEIRARLEVERRRLERQERASEVEAEKVYQETFGREAAKQPAPTIDKSTPWIWVAIRTEIETSEKKCWFRARVNMDPKKGGLFQRPYKEKKCELLVETRSGPDGTPEFRQSKTSCSDWYCPK